VAVETSISIIVVDDSKTTVRIVCQMLQKCGFSDIAEAPNGLSAFERLRTSKFDLVISDVGMMPMNGIELLQAVRADRTLRDTCFILMTALRETENVLATKQYRADALLLKPFTAEILRQKLVLLGKLSPQPF
jgi:two-component system chemotaxis response regulator CheY